MAATTYLEAGTIQEASRPDAVRFSVLVRITHWLNTMSFVALAVSGFGILLAHPRFYWGETGGVGAPSVFVLPLPFVLGGAAGWGGAMNFSGGWVFGFVGFVFWGWVWVWERFRREFCVWDGVLFVG